MENVLDEIEDVVRSITEPYKVRELRRTVWRVCGAVHGMAARALAAGAVRQTRPAADFFTE